MRLDEQVTEAASQLNLAENVFGLSGVKR